MSADLDLNLLVALDVLLEEHSVTRAARKLGITQSAMSHRLRHLREQLGDPLLVPSGRELVPTARAEALAPVLRASLQALREAVRAPAPFDPASSRRRFVIFGSDFGEFTFIPEVIEQLRAEAPGVVLRSHPPTPDIAADLTSRAADLAIGPPLPEQAGLVQQLLPADPFVLVVRADHPRVRRRATLKQYLAADHLQVIPRGAPGSALDQLLHKRGMERRVALTVGHFTSAPFIVARTDLLWTAQQSIAQQAARYAQLRICKHPLALPAFRGAMTWHRRMHRDPGHVWLRQLIRRLLEEKRPRIVARRH